MRRSGAFTLAVVLTLGAVTGGRGQELSGSVTPAGGSPYGLDGLALPSVPENWADLPFKLTASQTESYNSNVSSFPIGGAPKGAVLGDFTSTTNVGFQTRANVASQQVFLDATFGVIHYLHDTQFNSTVYSVNAGLDWNVTSRCSGTLATSLSKSPGQLTEQVGTGINFTTTTALNETGKCAISNGYSLVFNSGLTTTTNSDPINSLNDARTALIAAGVEYAKGYSTLTALASISDQSFTDRTPQQAAVGLATETDFHSFTLNYTRQIDPNLSVSGTVGLVGVTSGFSLGLPKTLLPIYTVSGTWTLTPKLSLTASASKSISPPTTVVANAQQSYNAGMNLTYQLTPKVAVIAGGSVDYSTSSFTGAGAQALISPFVFSTQNTYNLNAGLNYSMTPFLSAALNASYSERVANHLITPQDVVTVSLNYRPY
jgi:Putative beta-barrel porin 2